MADRIRVHRIAVFARHGLLPEEERLGQRFYISLECRLDLREAGRSDDVAATVSYADLTEIAVDIATNRRFALIEALAEAIAQACLARHARIETMTVRIEKPSAPIPAVLDHASVEIERSRSAQEPR